MSIAVAKICSKNAAKCRQNYASPPLHLEKSVTEDEVVNGKRENGSAMQVPLGIETARCFQRPT